MSILDEAKALQDVIVAHRRFIHQNAEVHLDLPITSGYVIEKLKEMGYEPQIIGTSGVVVIAGGKKPGKTFLIRGDMDALPIVEENDELPFKSETGNMHACGHDFHTSMMLGAAQILKNHEDEIEGQVKLMFQPGEETMSGGKMMVDAGILENPKVDAAMMIHVAAGSPMPAGAVMIPPAGIVTATCDWFTINIQGKGCHGAMPSSGIDPLNVMSHIHIALQAINAREIAAGDTVALTVGEMHGGNTSNVIPDTATMGGTIRTLDETIREKVKQRIKDISEGIGKSFGAEVSVEFYRGCPCVEVNETVNNAVLEYTKELLGENMVVDMSKSKMSSGSLGSEDFAYVSSNVPATMVNLGTGGPADGYHYPVHHPKVTFSEDALYVGTAVYANSAMKWLENNK